MPRLCEFYPGICLTTEEKSRKNLNQGKKNLSQVKKNLSQSTVYIYQNTHTLQNPHKTHTLQNPYIHAHTHTHTHTHITKQYSVNSVLKNTRTKSREMANKVWIFGPDVSAFWLS